MEKHANHFLNQEEADPSIKDNLDELPKNNLEFTES